MTPEKGTNKVKTSTKMFFSGVLVLTVCNILEKAIGLLFKIPIVNIIGDEGMGYFNSAYTIYTWLYMISTSGLPIAVLILVSRSRAKGRFKESRAIFRAALSIFLALGAVGTAIMIFGANFFADKLMASAPTYLSIIAVAPTLFFICISSAMRGYFQGHQQMLPTGISHVIEAVCKLVIGILFATWAIERGCPIHEVAAYTILGVTIGVFLGMLFLTITKLLFREEKYNVEFLELENDEVAPRKTIYKNLISIAIPITVSASVTSLSSLIDAVMVQNRLQSAMGFTQAEATAIYGNYTSLAVPFFNLPPVVVYPIANAIVPLLSAAIVAADEKRLAFLRGSAIRIVSMIGVPCAFGMSVMAEPILKLLFRESAAEQAAPLLSILAPATLFLCLLAISNSILQAHHKERVPIVSMLAGAVVKLVSNYVLMGEIGIYGTPISTVLCYITAVAVNFYFIRQFVGKLPGITHIFLRPILASAVAMAGCVAVYMVGDIFLPEKLATLAGILTAVVLYVAFVFLFKAITKEEILLLPKGQKIYALLHRVHLMK
ncbi:MAG: polysaccharide biosynthesis protein [Clostridia bacterium]|nr:polysaccharide biosynthesis protein [Clostridia bacterium]